MSVKVHNKGQRTIHFGKENKHFIAKGATANLSDEVAAKLLKLYPNEVIDPSKIAASYDVDEDNEAADQVSQATTVATDDDYRPSPASSGRRFGKQPKAAA